MPRKTFALAREKRIMTKTLKIDFFGSPNLLTASGPLVPPPPTPLLRHYLLCYPRERPLAHNPAGDGHSESMVKAVKQAIRLTIQTDAKHWCMLAKWAAFMYNCSYNSTIGTTPYFCRHGREPRHASDLIFNHPGTTDTVSLSQLVARINKVQASVQASVKAMHQRFIRKNATLNRTRQFKKDDKGTRRSLAEAVSMLAVPKAFYREDEIIEEDVHRGHTCIVVIAIIATITRSCGCTIV